MFSVVGAGLGLAAVVGVWWHWNAPGSAPEAPLTAAVSASANAPEADLAAPWIAEVPAIAAVVQQAARPALAAVVETASEAEPTPAPAPESELEPEPVSDTTPEPATAITAAVTASAPSPAEVNRLRNRLVMAIDSQDHDMVEATLATLRDTLGEESVFYQRLQAFTWLRSQQWAEAEQAYDALLLQHGDDADARFNSGRLALRRGDLDKAEQRLRPLQRHPEYRQAVAAMLAELDRQQRHAQAVR